MLFTTSQTPTERTGSSARDKRERQPSTERSHVCQCGARLTEDPTGQLRHVRTAHPHQAVQVRKDTTP